MSVCNWNLHCFPPFPLFIIHCTCCQHSSFVDNPHGFPEGGGRGKCGGWGKWGGCGKCGRQSSKPATLSDCSMCYYSASVQIKTEERRKMFCHPLYCSSAVCTPCVIVDLWHYFTSGICFNNYGRLIDWFIAWFSCFTAVTCRDRSYSTMDLQSQPVSVNPRSEKLRSAQSLPEVDGPHSGVQRYLSVPQLDPTNTAPKMSGEKAGSQGKLKVWMHCRNSILTITITLSLPSSKRT